MSVAIEESRLSSASITLHEFRWKVRLDTLVIPLPANPLFGSMDVVEEIVSQENTRSVNVTEALQLGGKSETWKWGIDSAKFGKFPQISSNFTEKSVKFGDKSIYRRWTTLIYCTAFEGQVEQRDALKTSPKAFSKGAQSILMWPGSRGPNGVALALSSDTGENLNPEKSEDDETRWRSAARVRSKSNQRILIFTCAAFFIYVVSEYVGASISGSLSLLGDAAAMSVDVFTVSSSCH